MSLSSYSGMVALALLLSGCSLCRKCNDSTVEIPVEYIAPQEQIQPVPYNSDDLSIRYNNATRWPEVR